MAIHKDIQKKLKNYHLKKINIMEVKKIDKVNVEFYITSKRKLRFNLQLQKIAFVFS